MKKMKLLLIGLAITAAIVGCGKKADDTEVTTTQATEVQSVVEETSSAMDSEETSEVMTTEVTSEPVAQISSPEEDEIYNYGMISGLGIDQEDAKKAAVYLSGISYGRIASAERLELTDHTYIELKNNEQIVIYLYLLSDGKIKELTDMNLHTLLVISEDSNSGASGNTPTQSNNDGSTGTDSNSQSSSDEPFDWSIQPDYVPSGF